MPEITADQLVARRTENLLLGSHDRRTPLQVTEWLGALQAQDLGSALWSYGARLPQLNRADVEAAVETGQILRTWPMRGTIHFVPAVDAGWMLQTFGVRQLDKVQARWDFLGLDRQTVERAAAVLQESLQGGRRLRRSEALSALKESGVDVSGQRGYHCLWYAAQIGVTCLGPNDGKEQTVVLLDEWVERPVTRDAQDGARELALRYVRSHGPVTHQDFARWAGVGATAAKQAITANDDIVETVRVDGTTMWQAAGSPDAPGPPDALTLPGFDEFVLGYGDRSVVLAERHKDRIVPGGNGVFRSTVVLRGQIRGTWRRTRTTRSERIEITPFDRWTTKDRRAAERAIKRYGRFQGLPVSVSFS